MTHGVAITNEKSSSLHQKRSFDIFRQDDGPSASHPSEADDIRLRTLINEETPTRKRPREDVSQV